MSDQIRRPTGIVYENCIWPAIPGYELVSPYYDNWYWQIFWAANERPLIVRELMKFCVSAAPALDVGTGTGLYLKELLRLGIDYVGVDICKAMLDEAKKKLPASVRLICANVEKLPFPDKTFNLAIACRVLSHVPSLSIAMQELGRVTNIGCSIVISDVSSCHNYTTTRIPTPDGDVHIETHKYTIEQLISTCESTGYWKLDHIESVAYKDLLWRPQPSDYPTIDISSKNPIFFYGIFTRL